MGLARLLTLRFACRATAALLILALASLVATRAHGQATAAAAAPLHPTADSYVSAAQARRNFGSARRMVVGGRGRAVGYLRFQLAAPAEAGTRFVLRLYPLTSSRRGLILRRSAPVPWAERRLTFRTAPHTGPRVVRTGPLRAHRWTTVDVTHLTDGAPVVSLALIGSTRARIALASRETGARAPQLLVVPVATAGVAAGSSPASPGARPGAPAGSRPAPGAARPAPVPAPAPGGSPSPSAPCGVTATPPAWQHVVWIWFENKADSQVMGSSNAPYFNQLAAKCGRATASYAETHPSLPNYIAATSGGTQGVADDNPPSSHPLNVPSIFSQLGSGWKSLEESMPGTCALTSSGQYAVKHNPAAYYTNIRAACAQQDIPLSNPPDISAHFTFVTPNLCNDMHDCAVSAGDLWLSQWMPKFLNTPEYLSGTTAIFVTFDEDNGSQGNRIPTIIVSPSTPAGLTDATHYTHYSQLRTAEEMLGLPLLGQAATATSMRAGMHL